MTKMVELSLPLILSYLLLKVNKYGVTKKPLFKPFLDKKKAPEVFWCFEVRVFRLRPRFVFPAE
jgi:hypothetical protein